VETIYKTSAFQDVIFGARPRVRNPLPLWTDAGIGLVTVRFSITCDPSASLAALLCPLLRVSAVVHRSHGHWLAHAHTCRLLLLVTLQVMQELHQSCLCSHLVTHCLWSLHTCGHRDYTLRAGRSVFVYGSVEELGSWQESRAVQLGEVDTPVWEGDITIPCTSFPFSYRSSLLLSFVFSLSFPV
jgi:hypothetical protein